MDYSKGRKLYTPIEVYDITYKAFLTVRKFGHGRKEKLKTKTTRSENAFKRNET